MRRRIMAMSFFVILGLMGVVWVANSVAYGHEELLTYTPIFYKFFPLLTVSSSLAAMFVHFARKEFEQFKRMFDFIIATLSLILVSPLLLIISILIKLDSAGPVFFKQTRMGRKGNIFNMWKFRTMRDKAEIETGPVWADEDDPRTTNLGRLLRRAHLDELPQLINVFKGEMSLIGPRPERPELREVINGSIPAFDKRLDVRPGITGLAQVRYNYGASIKDAARKLKFDLLYIKRMGWALDFQIIFWTLGRVMTGEGAR